MTSINLTAFDTLAARLTQARATLTILSLAAEGQSALSPELVASASWAADTLLEQAQIAVDNLRKEK